MKVLVTAILVTMFTGCVRQNPAPPVMGNPVPQWQRTLLEPFGIEPGLGTWINVDFYLIAAGIFLAGLVSGMVIMWFNERRKRATAPTAVHQQTDSGCTTRSQAGR